MKMNNIKPNKQAKSLAWGIIALLFPLTSFLFVACSQDDGNYDYLPDEEVSQIKLVVDSTLTPNPYAL